MLIPSRALEKLIRTLSRKGFVKVKTLYCAQTLPIPLPSRYVESWSYFIPQELGSPKVLHVMSCHVMSCHSAGHHAGHSVHVCLPLPVSPSSDCSIQPESGTNEWGAYLVHKFSPPHMPPTPSPRLALDCGLTLYHDSNGWRRPSALLGLLATHPPSVPTPFPDKPPPPSLPL